MAGQWYRLPDGSFTQLPAGMSEDDFAAKVQEQYGGNNPTQDPVQANIYASNPTPRQTTGPLRYAGLAGQAAGTGLVHLGGLAGDLEAIGSRYIANPLDNLTGLPPEPANPDGSPVTVFPTSQKLMGIVQNGPLAPLVGSPGLTPGLGAYPNAERLGTQVIQGAVTGLGAGGLGALGGTARGEAAGAGPLMMAGTGAAGVLGGAAANAVFPDSTAAQVLGGTLGGLTFGGIGHTVDGMLQRNAAQAAVGTAEPLAQTASREAQDLTQGNSAAALQRQAALANLRTQNLQDFTNTKSAALAQQEAASQAADATTQRVLGALGGPLDMQNAGQAAQQTARDWLTNIHPKLQKQIFAPVDATVPADHPVPPNNFAAALQDMTKEDPVLQPLLNRITPSLPRDLNNSMQSILSPAEDGTVATPNWQGMRQLRDALGDAVQSPTIARDAAHGQLEKAYATVQDDMRDSLSELPPGEDGMTPQAHYIAATQTSNMLHKVAEGTFGKLVTAGTAQSNDPLGGQMAGQMLNRAMGPNGDASDLQILRQHAPAATNALAQGLLTTQPDKWLNLTDQAKEALAPGHVADLDAQLGAKADAQAQAQATIGAARQAMQASNNAAAQAHAEATRAEQAQALAAQQRSTALGRTLADAQTQLNTLTPAKRDAFIPYYAGTIGSAAAEAGKHLLNAFGGGGTGGLLPGGLSSAHEGAAFLAAAMGPMAKRGLQAGLARPTLPVVAAGLAGGDTGQ